ncbi:hypothetical protein Tco_0748279 [Tanacetum coccineum]|uniref:Uncharacterized protein n=1 Tax=Tanacetum coccineum TaxID=301880 RepID=A0ABQ4YY54_9ASTR
MSSVKMSIAERTRKALDDGLVVTESSGTEIEKQDTSNRSGNDTDALDADIRTEYDEEPKAKVDSNITPDSTNMSNNGGEIDYNAKKCQDTSHLLNPLTERTITE